MAVKHKMVECRDPATHPRLHVILRALEQINTESGLTRTDITKTCEYIVMYLGTMAMPATPEDYKSFMADIEQVQHILAKVCSSEQVVFDTLKALYNGISDPEKQPSPAMSVVLQLIDVKTIPTAVKWILDSGYPEHSLEQALLTLCNWLSKWIYTPNLGMLVLYFMQGLEAELHYDILIEVTRTYIEQLFKLCVLSQSRKGVGSVVIYILEKMQHSPEAFHKIIPHIDRVLSFLSKENTDSSQYYLHKFVNLFMALMDHFPDYPDLYDPLKQTLELYEPTKLYKQTLTCKSWLSTNNSTVTVVPLSSKVGLNNLGNTCYMNSVLQALFMTKPFRNRILLSSRDTTPLFSKLQSLFALLQFSQRCSLSPNDILNLARPPGFQQGHQHDSSEFLGYLLDVLHEQEKSIYSNTTDADNVQPGPSNHTLESTVVQRSFGGRAVTLSRCIVCRSHSERADSFRELQLSIPTNCTDHSVQSLLDFYLQPEQLCGDNQYRCDNCRALTDGERISRIVEPPAHLILTLKHFRYDPASQQRTKLLVRVHLDSRVALEDARYALYAAIVHCGSSVDSGHYYTYARDDEEDWYKFNDYLVFKTKPEELCRLHPPETPYMLFYRREDAVEPEPVLRSQLSQRLQSVLLQDGAELEAEKKRRQVVVSAPRPPGGGNGDPPPPGCGEGSFLDSTYNRYIC